MANKRFNRRGTRPIEDLPSLFEGEDTPEELSFKVTIPEQPDKGDASAISPDDDLAVDERYTKRPETLRFLSLGSGSSGNCSYIGTKECGLLIDAGVDNNFVTKELARNGIDISTIKGILLTHDHTDHVRYAYALLRRNQWMRLYATPRIIEAILTRLRISRRIKDYHTPIYKEHEYLFGNITVIPFETSHDGADNCGYYITMGSVSFVIATDMGIVTERADYYMRKAGILMIESDYDEQMLEESRYADYLKARIRGARGHMSNHDTARYLREIYTPALTHIFLCHLSEQNNTPETAVATVLNELRNINIRPAVTSGDIPAGTVYLSALPRFTTSELYCFPSK